MAEGRGVDAGFPEEETRISRELGPYVARHGESVIANPHLASASGRQALDQLRIYRERFANGNRPLTFLIACAEDPRAVVGIERDGEGLFELDFSLASGAQPERFKMYTLGMLAEPALHPSRLERAAPYDLSLVLAGQGFPYVRANRFAQFSPVTQRRIRSHLDALRNPAARTPDEKATLADIAAHYR